MRCGGGQVAPARRVLGLRQWHAAVVLKLLLLGRHKLDRCGRELRREAIRQRGWCRQGGMALGLVIVGLSVRLAGAIRATCGRLGLSARVGMRAVASAAPAAAAAAAATAATVSVPLADEGAPRDNVVKGLVRDQLE